MSKYHILEKEGHKETITYPKTPGGCVGHYCCSCGETEERHTPKFIVQEEKGYSNLGYWFSNPYTVDLKEFTSLEEAREYKRSLELKEGIVRE
jgi:hypothetical protein